MSNTTPQATAAAAPDLHDELLGLITDETQALMQYAQTEEPKHHIAFFDGNFAVSTQPGMENTPLVRGGLRFPIDTLTPEQVEDAKAKGYVVPVAYGNSVTDYIVYPKTEVQILAYQPIRRYFGDYEGSRQLLCGTNFTGLGAMGWSGMVCESCPYNKRNAAAGTQETCSSSIALVVRVPALGYTGILHAKGRQYMQALELTKYIGKLQKAYGSELAKRRPGISRVPSWFFKVKIFGSPDWKQGDHGSYREMTFNAQQSPFNFAEALASVDDIKAAEAAMKDLEESFRSIYLAKENPTALMSKPMGALPAAPAAPALTTSAPPVSPAPTASAASAAPQVVERKLDDDMVAF